MTTATMTAAAAAPANIHRRRAGLYAESGAEVSALNVTTVPALISGGSDDVRPEQSRSYSFGTILTPRILPGLRVSVDYTRIEKSDEIQTPTSQFILDNEDDFPGRIVRGPNLTGDPANWAGPIISFDSTLMNIASTSVEAVDLQMDYTWRTENGGEFRGYTVFTRQLHYKNQTRPIDPVIEYVGFSDGRGLKWRGNFGLDWTRGPLTVGWNAQYYDSYLGYTATSSEASIASFVSMQGTTTIPSQIYHDLIATYHFGSEAFMGRILGDSDLSIGIQNVLDAEPPILASGSPTNAGYSTYGDPRLRRYTLSLRKQFGR